MHLHSVCVWVCVCGSPMAMTFLLLMVACYSQNTKRIRFSYSVNLTVITAVRITAGGFRSDLIPDPS